MVFEFPRFIPLVLQSTPYRVFSNLPILVDLLGKALRKPILCLDQLVLIFRTPECFRCHTLEVTGSVIVGLVRTKVQPASHLGEAKHQLDVLKFVDPVRVKCLPAGKNGVITRLATRGSLESRYDAVKAVNVADAVNDVVGKLFWLEVQTLHNVAKVIRNAQPRHIFLTAPSRNSESEEALIVGEMGESTKDRGHLCTEKVLKEPAGTYGGERRENFIFPAVHFNFVFH